MKLYTKEMFLIAAEKCEVSMIDARHIMKYIDEYVTPIQLPTNLVCVNCDESKPTHNICMDCIIKVGKENIELPSDEEIEEQSWGYREVTKDMEIPPNEDWSNGAKWMRDKIKGGNK